MSIMYPIVGLKKCRSSRVENFPSVRSPGDSDRSLRQPAGEAAHHVGAHCRRDEKLSVAKATARGTDRVHRVDTRRASEAFELRGTTGGQRSAGSWARERHLSVASFHTNLPQPDAATER